MTLKETRQLGIEFERRIQTMIPDTEFLEKLDTDTIYAYLNQYQDKYIHDIYRSLDQIPSGSKLSAHVESVLQSMLVEKEYDVNEDTIYEDGTSEIPITAGGQSIIGTGRSVTYKIDDDFYMYVRSVSKVSQTYSFKQSELNSKSPIRVIPNQLVSQNEVWKLIETPHDSLRILRYPAAILNKYAGDNPTITVIYDRYTTPEAIKLTYYKQPKHFDLMTSTRCELPMDAFDDLVSGAVDLYVQYVAGAEARKRQLDEARRQAAKEQEANNARRGRNNE